MPLNESSTRRERQRSMSSERGNDEGEGAEGMESLEEPLRQRKPSLRRESRQGTDSTTTDYRPWPIGLLSSLMPIIDTICLGRSGLSVASHVGTSS